MDGRVASPDINPIENMQSITKGCGNGKPY